MVKIKGPEGLEQLREEGHRSLFPPEGKLLVGMASCGLAAGAGEAYAKISEEVSRHGLGLVVGKTGCLGFCSKEPLIEVRRPEGLRLIYHEIDEDKAGELIASLARGDYKPEWALCRIVEREQKQKQEQGNPPPPAAVETQLEEIPLDRELAFYRKQRKIVLRNCGLIDPLEIKEYIARGGYSSLYKALQMEPEAIIAEIKRSGLRGRGGAGFPTGLKWEYCRKASGDKKYVICNADEGDPGAYMDRSLLEGDPHAVIEGMIIGAYAVGANEGYIYVRAEYPLAVEHLRRAIAQAEELGLLGEDILGTGFSFHIELKEGAGAFVCGEETALMASIEGKRGMPRPRPPFPAESGLWGKPTNINNVETWANVPQIIEKGASWYGGIGTEKSKGTKVFSLVGKINHTGLVEVPMGTTLGEIIHDIGGGIPRGKAFKAVQTGGPSGGCIPRSLLNLPVDYERLAETGSIMGSGGMIVMDEDTCMVDVAKYFLSFLADESCGKCPPCRLGTKRMLEILTRISEGLGEEGDLALLIELGETIKDSALCGLGQTAPNPVLSTIRYFREEYEAHIREKRCPAAVCEGLVYAPCEHSCPVGVDAVGYIALIAAGRFEEALELIRERNPLPGVCGRVCHHPCEAKCRRGELDEPIAICALKRFVADRERSDKNRDKGEKVTRADGQGRERIAIVGSGPAGLNAAYHLAKRGYSVTIFEALPQPGGMLVAGIPEFRLPREVLQRDITFITDLGVEIKTETPVGQDPSLEDLLSEYKAVFIAVGAHKGRRLELPGEELEGVIDGVSFLRELNLHGDNKLKDRIEGRKVVVIGGGNVAIDAARSALRLGAEEVMILYRRTREEMPAIPEEIAEAEHEGVKFSYLVAPNRILGHGRVEGIECIRMTLGEFDPSGRRRPIPLEGSQFSIEVGLVISAIGQIPDLEPFSSWGLRTTPQGTLAVDQFTLATEIPGVFAGGDVVSGPATVIEAMAAGERAAISIDRYLRGQSLTAGRVRLSGRHAGLAIPRAVPAEELKEQGRIPIPMLPLEERRSGFKEVNLTLSEEAAVAEARRCLRCDLERYEGRER